MHHIVLTGLQTFLIAILSLWIVCLGFSVILQQSDKYLTWSRHTIKTLWHKCWQFIIGLAIGYWLSGAPLLEIEP